MPFVPSMRSNKASCHDEGTDFLESIPVTNASFQPGSEVFQITVDAGISERLRTNAGRFQRIKWHDSSVQVAAGFPSLAGGMYAVAYVRDPTDRPPAGSAKQKIAWLMAQQGAQLLSWTQPATVRMPRCPDLLWTSSQDKAPNFTSPGQVIALCVEPPQQPGNLALRIHWNVDLSEPSLETAVEEGVFEYTHTLLRDAMLTWYPYNGSYGHLVMPTELGIWNPTTHADRPIIDFEMWGLGDIPDGSYLYSDKPITFTGQFTSGTGEPQCQISTHLWKKDKLQYSGSTDTLPIITPITRYMKPDYSGYDVEFACYVNSTGSGAHTWADVYAGLITLPAGTRFGFIDPTAHYAPETYTVYRAGRKVRVPTGRMILADPAIPQLREEMIPYVRVLNTGTNPAQRVEVTNLPAVQDVSVGNWPTSYSVAGTVGAHVDNWPTSYPVEGSVSAEVSNWPSSSHVHVDNFPTTQAVSGSVSISGDVTATIDNSTPMDVVVTNSTGNPVLTQQLSGKTVIVNPDQSYTCLTRPIPVYMTQPDNEQLDGIHVTKVYDAAGAATDINFRTPQSTLSGVRTMLYTRDPGL